MKQNLTKENFWNDIMELYPKSCKLFCDWVDKYKEENNWDNLFNARTSRYPALDTKAPKFHEIPYAMQHGIWIEFANEILNEMFEQADYDEEIKFDLVEDINKVFSEIEQYLD